MNYNIIEIKEKRSNFLTIGICWLFLSVGSLFFALMPYLFDFAAEKKIMFLAIGGIAFIFFISLFVYLLMREIKPQNALVLNNHGFSVSSLGSNVEIEWTNISSIGIFGTKKSPLFGIRLENNDIVLAMLHGKAAEEMRDNLEENLPSILIPQQDIRTSLKELKELFNKFIRESRALENTEPQKVKTNPFSSEDVIRAFGGTENDIAAYKAEKQASSLKDDLDTKTAPVDTKPTSESKSKTIISQDDFYDILLKKTGSSVDTDSNVKEESENPPAKAESKDLEDDSVTDEINELLGSVRLSKIPEIEKMLADPNLPYSLSRDASVKQKTDLDILITPSQQSQNSEMTHEDIFTHIGQCPSVEEVKETKTIFDHTENDISLPVDSPVSEKAYDNAADGSDSLVDMIKNDNEPNTDNSSDTKANKSNDSGENDINKSEIEFDTYAIDFSKLEKNEPHKTKESNFVSKNTVEHANEDYPPVVIFDDEEEETDKKPQKTTPKESKKIDPTDFFFVATIDEK